jgi:hypothetical protein
MRENRPYGSEGGEGSTLPDPYRRGPIRKEDHHTGGNSLRCPTGAISEACGVE